jgi:hypothetical protein
LGDGKEQYEQVVLADGLPPKDEEKELIEPKRAMMDLGAKFKAKNTWNAKWNNPRLDSKTGVHNAKNNFDGTWWEVDFDGDDYYSVNAMTLAKRGDGRLTRRVITAVQFEVSYDHGQSWDLHADGKWFKTGAQTKDKTNV